MAGSRKRSKSPPPPPPTLSSRRRRPLPLIVNSAINVISCNSETFTSGITRVNRSKSPEFSPPEAAISVGRRKSRAAIIHLPKYKDFKEEAPGLQNTLPFITCLFFHLLSPFSLSLSLSLSLTAYLIFLFSSLSLSPFILFLFLSSLRFIFFSLFFEFILFLFSFFLFLH